MPLAVAVLLAVNLADLPHARTSRAAFCHAIATIEPDCPRARGTRDTVVISLANTRRWTKGAVKRILGQPDEVRFDKRIPNGNYQLIMLVQSDNRSVDFVSVYQPESNSTYERLHEEFLQRHCNWNPARQINLPPLLNIET